MTRAHFSQYDGPFRINKADPARPRRLHPTRSAAEAEALRLLDQHPGETFIISQDVGCVRRSDG